MKRLTLQDFQRWVGEAMYVHRQWRSEAWVDSEYYDGSHWSQDDILDAANKGIDELLTINRVFPVVNLITGSQALNKKDIIAKARTQKDSEQSNIMTEAIKFVADQNNGEYLISQAFRDQVVPGAGYIELRHNKDPRFENIKLDYVPWTQIWFDPYGDPWLDPEKCRYVFRQPWMDVDQLVALYPEKEKAIYDAYGDSRSYTGSNRLVREIEDEAQFVEEYKLSLAGPSITGRRRVRPCEMWYTAMEDIVYAKFKDDSGIEIQDMTGPQLAEVVMAADVIYRATVPKIKTITFYNDLLLHQGNSPYKHDRYPFIPFLGYLDRFGFPFGVPRQIRGQNREVNKRRTMALVMLKTRRIILESDAVDDADQDALQRLYEEANKPDGMLIVKPGALSQGKVKIEENAELARTQMEILMQSEREIQQISGANDEASGYRGQTVSGKALEERKISSSTMIASLSDNLARSMKILGDQVTPEIQSTWTREKVIRITDRMTGVDKFLTLNQRVVGPGNAIQLRNDITQGKYDTVITDAPITDTVREKYMEMIIEWVKKAPPQVIPMLMSLAFEMSELPNKEQLMLRLKPLLGINPLEEDMPPEKMKEKVIMELEAQKQALQESAEIEKRGKLATLEGLLLDNKKKIAEIEQLLANSDKTKRSADLEEFRTGYNLSKEALQAGQTEANGKEITA